MRRMLRSRAGKVAVALAALAVTPAQLWATWSVIVR